MLEVLTMHRTMNRCPSAPTATLAAIRGVLTDIDETVSTDGRLTAEAYGALEALKEAGFLVIPVTGRPAGWCDLIARFWPVDAVVGENGAFWMWHDARRASSHPLRPAGSASGPTAARRLEAVRAEVLRDVPGPASPPTSPIALADLAIDFCEDVPPLPHDDDRCASSAIFEAHGAHAKVSSIHVNGWFGDYDKLTTSKAMMAELFGVDLGRDARTLCLLRRFAQRRADVRLLSQCRRRGQRARLRRRR